MTLKEYRASEDPNAFWKLSSGEHLNLLDEAIGEIERLQRENADLQKHYDECPLTGGVHDVADLYDDAPVGEPRLQARAAIAKELQRYWDRRFLGKTP